MPSGGDDFGGLSCTCGGFFATEGASLAGMADKIADSAIGETSIKPIVGSLSAGSSSDFGSSSEFCSKTGFASEGSISVEKEGEV